MGSNKFKKKTPLSRYTKKDGTIIFMFGCGTYYNNEGTIAPARFYLGQDETAAYYKREIIRAAREQYKAEGHVVWPDDKLTELEGKGIISAHTAATFRGSKVKRVLNTILLAAEDKDKQLDLLRDKGSVPIQQVPDFMLTLLTQQFAEKEQVDHFRRFLTRFAQDKPLEALKLWSEMWTLLKDTTPTTQGGVTLNFGNLIPVDASEHRRQVDGIIKGTIDTASDNNK